MGWVSSLKGWKNMFQELQAQWVNKMEELGIFEDIVDSFDSVGEVY